MLFLCSLLLSFSVAAQKIDILKKGHNFYKEKEYKLALNEYEKLWTSGSGAKILGVDGKMNLANCYRLLDQPFKAKELYMATMSYFNDKPEAHLNYGQVLMALGQYNDAVAQFERHLELMPEDGRAQEYLKQIEKLKDIQPLYANVEIIAQNLVNDSLSNQTGVDYYGDAIIYASSQIENDPNQKFYNMRISGLDEEGNMKASEKFNVALNQAGRDNGPATFSRDGRLIYYTISTTDPEGKAVQQIWLSSFRDNAWSEAIALPIMFQGKDFTQPSLSAEGKQLYFSSNMKGSFGGYDIWVSNFEEGRWTYPKNLGKDINTDQDEGWPFIHPDGDLYFSSKGHSGYGGYDIFRTRPLGNGVDWLDVENLGQPFNSSFSDISFLMADNQIEGFMVSNRNKSFDIYKFTLIGEAIEALPEGIEPRVSMGKSATRVFREDVLTDKPLPVIDDQEDPIIDDFVEDELPPQQEDETKKEYDQRIREFKKNNQPPKPPVNTVVTPTTSDKVELIVKMQVIDGFGNGLANAQIVVKNKFTGKTRTFDTDAKGLTEIRLDPNQKYSFVGQKSGYTESSIPVSTMGVTETEKVAASLQLQAN